MGVKIKEWLGINKNTPYVSHYLEEANIKASIYMAVVVIMLELFMILRTLVKYVILGDESKDLHWVITHFSSYFILITAAIVLLIVSVDYIRKKISSGVLAYAVILAFAAISLSFGMYIASVDYTNGNQVLTFIGMELYIIALISWRPIVSFVLSSSTFIVFRIICQKAAGKEFSEGDRINYFIFWLFMLMVSVSLYHQRRSAALKDEKLLDANKVLEKLSVEDELTGIKNVKYFLENIEKILSDPSVRLSDKIFLFMDVENFKAYNNQYGFHNGNKYLKDLALKLEEIFEDSLVTRQSDDHFMVFTDRKNVFRRIEEVKKHIAENQRDIKQGLKVGGYIPPERKLDPRLGCDRARYACSIIKSSRDRDYLEYDEKMHESFTKRQYIVNNIDNAVNEGWIRVFYQPIIRTESGKVCEFEALARWIDPKYGFLSPADFIPVLESMRQIDKLDRCIFETVCNDIDRIREMGKKVLPVSINISRLDFELMDTVEMLEEGTSRHNIPRECIHLEITESALNEDVTSLDNAVLRLSDKGFNLWLDDFGAGYSSLNVLKDYSFNVVKLDMKFLTNFNERPKAKIIIRNIIKLAEDLEMTTLTEGVETEEQAVFLREIGCEKMQGYLFGKPMAFDNMVKNISDGTYAV